MKCYNHLREASYALSSVGGTIVTKIPQGELIEAYYKFAKSKDGGKGTGETLSKKSIPDFVKSNGKQGIDLIRKIVLDILIMK